MKRPELIEVFARYRAGAPAIVGPGVGSREVFALAHAEPTLYQMDMAYAAPLCLGLALANERQRIVAIEGDGSLLAGLSVLTTIGRYQPTNLVVLVLDNESYSSIASAELPAVGSATADRIDLEQLARACGIRGAVTIRTPAEAEAAFSRALSEPGPWVVVAKVEDDPALTAQFRLVETPDLFENSLDFAEAVRAHLANR